ncbi:hypothetical protein Zmor_011023 [Zophobas morio]|uniref:Regulatory protein zeste n=1 Tax=Zophobas morio TaxID=2755281 RepID=A0AA38MKI2_9CUCU|nr:hypothetical protein Zmor_011023 [Zophobas morio]
MFPDSTRTTSHSKGDVAGTQPSPKDWALAAKVNSEEFLPTSDVIIGRRRTFTRRLNALRACQSNSQKFVRNCGFDLERTFDIAPRNQQKARSWDTTETSAYLRSELCSITAEFFASWDIIWSVPDVRSLDMKIFLQGSVVFRDLDARSTDTTSSSDERVILIGRRRSCLVGSYFPSLIGLRYPRSPMFKAFGQICELITFYNTFTGAMEKRKRAQRITQQQHELYVEELEGNVDFRAQKFVADKPDLLEKIWEGLVAKLNSVGGPQKSVQQFRERTENEGALNYDIESLIHRKVDIVKIDVLITSKY